MDLKKVISKIVKEVFDTEVQPPLYVEYVGERSNEEPFMLQGAKYQYVNGKYPDGKVDIAVYAFAGDLVYGYESFRKMHNLKEENVMENDFDFGDEGPQPGDAEYHYPKQSPPQTGIGNFNNIDWQVLHETLMHNAEVLNQTKNAMTFNDSDFTDNEEGMLTREELNLLMENDIIDLNGDIPIIDNPEYFTYENFRVAAENSWNQALSSNQPQRPTGYNSESPYMRGNETDGG